VHINHRYDGEKLLYLNYCNTQEVNRAVPTVHAWKQLPTKEGNEARLPTWNISWVTDVIDRLLLEKYKKIKKKKIKKCIAPGKHTGTWKMGHGLTDIEVIHVASSCQVDWWWMTECLGTCWRHPCSGFWCQHEGSLLQLRQMTLEMH